MRSGLVSNSRRGKPGRILASRDGIALLMVLWALTVLMVIVLSFSYAARVETNSTLSFKDGIEKKFLAEAGIQRGIVEVLYRIQNLTLEGGDIWKTDGTSYADRMGDGGYTVGITDESGKLDLNTLTDSSGIILKNLLMNAGVKEEDADTVVDSVLDWKDGDDLRRMHGAEDDYYMSLPTPYKAKNANFDTLEELLLVKGITPEILYGSDEGRGIIDFLTIHSRASQINVNAAPKEVLSAIPGITPEMADTITDYREAKKITSAQEVSLPPESLPFVGFADSS
ncbi:MAG: general secretion pathway protein GspK, partial [Nitrospirae bacterium]|nr:general secretion pathway protein GspK [Nitrospirota bacterium]